jgi:hypothetical protein
VDEPQRGSVWRDMDDATLLMHLGQALRGHEQPPAHLVELAKAGFGLRRLDAELAALVADSLDDLTGPRVRSVRAPRMVSFEAPGLTLEVELTPAGAGWRVVGQIDPPGPATVRLRGTTGVSDVTADADRLGRFALDVAEAGPISLLCQRPGERPVVTTWVLLG